MKSRKLFVAFALLAASTSWAAPCEPLNFVIKNLSTSVEYGYIVFVGTVVNGSAVRCAVQLKASTYDKKGAVLDTKNFWPAKLRGLAPDAAENFKIHLRDFKETSTYEFVPIDVRY